MLIPILVIAVLAILLIVGLIKSANNWSWIQIVSVILVFIVAIPGGYAISKALKIRAAWHDQYQRNEASLAMQKAARDEALYGPDDAIEYDMNSLRGVNAYLANSQIGKGRVWTAGSPTNQNGQIVVSFSTVDGVSPANQLKQDMNVFAFADGAATIDDRTISIPLTFIGTFQVVSVNGDNVTFQPKYVTNNGEAEVAQPTTSWSFFEKMPADSRDVFLQDMDGDESIDMSVYREALMTKYLPAEMMGMDPNSAEYEQLLDEYTFDGRGLNEIDAWLEQQTNRIDDRFDPAPENRLVELLFNDKQEYSVDSPGSIENEGTFNNIGQAVDPKLHYGGPASIDKDERVKIDRLSAVDGYQLSPNDRQEPMTDTIDAEVVGEFYTRPLRDYPYLLEELGNQAEKMAESKARVDADIADTNVLVARAQEQINNRDEIISKLQDDITRLQQDLADVTTLLTARQAEYDNKQQQIKTYYNQILELYEQAKQNQDGTLGMIWPDFEASSLANK